MSDTAPIGRYRLWSLYDMLRFYAESFVEAMRQLSASSTILSASGALGAQLDDEDRQNLLGILGPLEDQIRRLPFSHSLQQQFARFKAKVETSENKELAMLGEELHANVVAELASRVFLMIPEQDADLYREPEAALTAEVREKFKEVMYDFEAAGRCRALGEPTAAVLHLMRVHEVLLRHLGKMAKIPVAKDKTIEYQECQRIIDEIQAMAKALPSGKKGGVRAARKREFYNEVAGYLYHIKDAWRAPAAHGRSKYDNREAELIWENTKALMQRLAAEWLPRARPSSG